MGLIGRYRYRVQGRDLDFTRKMSIVSLSECILRFAGDNAEENGAGTRGLLKNNLGWVLVRLAVEYESPLEQDEQFFVETWIEEVTRLTTTRNFILYNAGNEVIGGGCSHWAMIDMETRRPVDLSRNLAYTGYIVPKESIIRPPAKIRNAGGEKRAVHRVKYSDIDLNQHTSSMKYLEWMLDCIPIERFEREFIRRIDMNFVREVRYGQQVDIFSEKNADDLFELKLPGGESVCKAILDWKPTKATP